MHIIVLYPGKFFYSLTLLSSTKRTNLFSEAGELFIRFHTFSYISADFWWLFRFYVRCFIFHINSLDTQKLIWVGVWAFQEISSILHKVWVLPLIIFNSLNAGDWLWHNLEFLVLFVQLCSTQLVLLTDFLGDLF